MNIVSYAVKTVEKSFTWCGHVNYTMMIENENELFMIVLILETNHQIKSCLKVTNIAICCMYTYTASCIMPKGNKYSNMLYVYLHRLMHTRAHKNILIYIYIIIISNVLTIRRIHDFTIINLVRLTPIGITYFNGE